MVAYFSHLFTDLITRSYGYVTNIFCCSHFTAESTHLQERKLKATPLCKSSFKLLSGFHLIIYIETHSRITEVFFFVYLCLGFLFVCFLLLTLKQITLLRSESRGSWTLDQTNSPHLYISFPNDFDI